MRRYRSGPSINQAVLLGIEILNEAKASSIYVGGPTNVVIATPAGIRSQPSERVQWTEAEIATQNDVFDALRFELGSTSAELNERLTTFSNSITAVRNLYGSKYPAWPKPTLGEDE
jgi:hypothetical protein